MSDKSYKTILTPSVAECIEKKSRFIGHISPISNEDEASSLIQSIKSKYWDASHNVYAFCTLENNITRCSDDGEPSGTAGVPILEVIKKEGLYNIVAVVTRYFGGTLLGAGGLVRAYQKSVKAAIDSATVVTMSPCVEYTIECDYDLWGKVQHMLLAIGVTVKSCLYQSCILAVVFVQKSGIIEFEKNIIDCCNGRVKIQAGSEVHLPR